MRKPNVGSDGPDLITDFVILEYHMVSVVIQRGGFCVITSQGAY
jgi:hypothetical protein